MMDDSGAIGQARHDPAVGLCARCAHVQVIVSDRQSRFYLCRLSAADPRFPKYPTLPVLACGGFLERPPDDSGTATRP